MIKNKQLAKHYVNAAQKHGANLNRKRKKKLKRAVIKMCKELGAIQLNKLDSFMGISLNKY